MIGRKKELDVLESMYRKEGFQFLVVYGRRRVGKTTLLQEFASRHDCIFFPAQEKNDPLNLADFSESVERYFDGDYLAPFANWEKALAYVGRHSRADKKTVLIIDEFPFLASSNPSIKSIFQHTIDHEWQGKNIFLILCGSSVSFMVNEVMGYKSPLYGRITGQMEVKPFDYLESSLFFPSYREEEKLLAYGILGGIPRYLRAFDPEKGIEENIRDHILSENAFLHEEPLMLLRMELREPGVYNSLLEAVASGYNRLSLLADHVHEESGKCSKYLKVLQDIRLVKKVVPCGENPESRKGIYELTDHFYRFWYRFPFRHANYYAIIGEEKAAQEIMGELSDFMGPLFESICQEYLVHRAQKGKLPFVPAFMGRWWGTNPAIKAQDDVDILCMDEKREEALFVECKFTNQPMPMKEYDDLMTAALAFPKIKSKHFLFISKGGYSETVKKRAEKEGTGLLTVQDLFEI